jgi:hypothetical protein
VRWMGAFTKHEMHEMSEETKVFYLDIPKPGSARLFLRSRCLP